MIEILHCAFAHKHARGGRKPKLPLKEQLLATLEYIVNTERMRILLQATRSMRATCTA
jgi:hypothetical protein